MNSPINATNSMYERSMTFISLAKAVHNQSLAFPGSHADPASLCPSCLLPLPLTWFGKKNCDGLIRGPAGSGRELPAADRWLTIGALHYAANLETLMEYEQYEASAPSPSSCCKLYCLRPVAFWLRFQQILTERNSPEGKNWERLTLMPSVTKGSGLD